jgi:Mg-chelatase subunit ChlD
MRPPALRLCALALLATACGAKTGLLTPTTDAAVTPDVSDAEPDVPDAAPDVTDAEAADACTLASQPAARFSAEVIFVTDRSGSMAERTPSGVTRWQAMTSALATVLPSVDRELWTGLALFPAQGTASSTVCAVGSGLDLAPRASNAQRILGALREATQTGGTPTWDGLRLASEYYRDNPPVGQLRGRFVVLTTDGGPNCNAGLNVRTCACTNPRGCFGPRANLSCLDADRTVAALEAMRARGVPTFVIGTGADVEVMDRLAVAGGRPRPAAASGTRYYRAEDAAEFAANFRAITTALVRCRYVTNPLPPGESARVRVGAASFREDPERIDGFAWDRRESGEFSLHGAACDAAAAGGAVRVELPCAP